MSFAIGQGQMYLTSNKTNSDYFACLAIGLWLIFFFSRSLFFMIYEMASIEETVTMFKRGNPAYV